MSLAEFFSEKQKLEEPIGSYISRMEVLGRKLKQKAEIRMLAIKQGIIRYNFKIREALVGEEKISQKLISKLAEIEGLEREKKMLLLRKSEAEKEVNHKCKSNRTCIVSKQADHFANVCPEKIDKDVNQVEDVAKVLKGDDFIDIDGLKVRPIFDSGANGNYMTKSMAKRLGMTPRKLKSPVDRYTCLGQKFIVAEGLRFAIREGGKTVGAGVVAKVIA